MPWWSRTRSTHRCSAVSMPRPSRSNFTRPAAAQSSLSHCSTERPSMRAHSVGQTSITGRSQMTMPPEWMPRCRGRSPRRWARSSTGVGMSSLAPSERSAAAGSGTPLQRSIDRRPGVLLSGGVAERPGGVAYRRAGPVGDDVRDLGRVGAAVALVDVLDDLFTTTGLDVDVDVGRAVALGREEPLEEQPEAHRVGLGDAQRVADRRVGRRAPPLAVDVAAATEVDDVGDDQEVAGEPQGADHRELVVDLRPGSGHPLGVAGPVAVGGARLDEVGEVVVLAERRAVGAVRVRWARVRRQRRRDERQVERAVAAELRSGSDHPGVALEAAGLFGAGAEVRGPAAGEPAVELVEGAAGADGGHGGGERAIRGAGVVDVVGRDGAHPGAHRESGERVVARRVERIAVVPQLDDGVLGAERRDQRAQLTSGRRRTVLDQRRGHGALATPGEHRPVAPGPAGGRLGHRGERQTRTPLLPRHLGLGEQRGEPGVALGVTGQDHQVGTLGVGRAAAGSGGVEGDLGTEDGRQPERAGGLGEADHAVEAIVIGDGEGVEAEPGGLLGQGLG